MNDRAEIRVGILSSLTGSLATIEDSIHRGALLAIEQVNAAGGVGGRRVVPLVADYGSDVRRAALEAGRLIDKERVVACVGGYTSSSRVALLPTFAGGQVPLLYPTYYEGLECEDNVVYAGAVPNQWAFDYLRWVFERLGSRVYVIGSDYVYPRTIAEVAERIATEVGATVVRSRFVPLDFQDFGPVVQEIASLKPDVIISNVVGSGSVGAFHKRLRAAGGRVARTPVAATVTSELELASVVPSGSDIYMAASYFTTLANDFNRAYVDAFARRWGKNERTHVVQVGAYNSIWLFSLAAARCADLTQSTLIDEMQRVCFEENPEGYALTVAANHHTVHPSYIGRARSDGNFDVIAEFDAREPEPYPSLLVPEKRRPLPDQ